MTHQDPAPSNAAMADTQPLSDRTLKYGRNTMALAGTIIVLAWVLDIEVEKFSPFGFEISAGDALPIWGVLGAVLAYYFISFVLGVWVDIPHWLTEKGSPLNELQRAEEDADRTQHPESIEKMLVAHHRFRSIRRSGWRRWVDIGLPSVMFLLALWAVLSRIAALLPSP